MKLAPAVWTVGGLFVLAAVGLLAPGLAGVVGAFVWLGVLPGMAAVRLLLPRAGATTRWTLGVALSPLASAIIGVVLVRAGHDLRTASHLVAMGSLLLFAAGEARALSSGGDDPDDAPNDRVAWGWAAGAAAFVALPPLINAWIRVRSDTWIHAGIVWEILVRGIPPQDPRFAGLPLNYVWIYNFLIAMLSSLRGQDPFAFMAVANTCWMGVQLWLAWQLAWCVWGERRAARGALPLLALGLNAGALLLWPLWLVRALRGEVRGMEEVRRIFAGAKWESTEVLHQLNAPYSWMVNFWDKFTIGTALGYAYLLMLVHLWAILRWHRASAPDRARGAWRWLAVVALSAAGMMLVHSVVGLSVIPCSLAATTLAGLLSARWRWLGPWRIHALAGVATLAGFAACLPYFVSISSGWDASKSGLQHHYFHLGLKMAWTLATACGVAALFAWAPARRAIAERNAAAAWLLLWLAGMLGFGLVIHLPESNEFKFVPQVLVALAVLGGAAWSQGLAAARRRLGTPLFAALFTIAFVLPSALFLYGYLADPAGRDAPALHPAPGERRLYAWMRDSTDSHAVFVDDHSRDLIMVQGRRRLLAGTTFGPERAAFPLDQLLRRRAASADLFAGAAHPAEDAALLDSLRAPAYVLFRAQDSTGAPPPWTALESRGDLFDRVYDADGFRVYRARPR